MEFADEMVEFYSAQIVLALEELHENEVVYGDLRPSNIMFDRIGNLKLTDYTLSSAGFNNSKSQN